MIILYIPIVNARFEDIDIVVAVEVVTVADVGSLLLLLYLTGIVIHCLLLPQLLF